MKIALVHDYLTSWGGAEAVLAALHELYPKAPIYTIYQKINKSPLLWEKFKNATIKESWFGRLPFCDKLISPLRFLIPIIWGSFDLSEYDLIISSASWAVTKGLRKGKTKEVCYCHTPPRYLYGFDTSRDWKKHWYIRAYALVVNHFMRMYDWDQAQKVTQFVANSREVQKRIRKFYRRESVVINPPVEITNYELRITNKSKNSYYLTGGRLELPKNFEVIIKAVNKLKVPLKIYGEGSQKQNLEKIAGKTVEFQGVVSEEEKCKLIRGCKAFICAATDEDFGITPVEAMAVGKPVIAYRGGGFLETVVEGKTGVFFDNLSVEGVIGGIRAMEETTGITKENCQKQAENFSLDVFKKRILAIVEEVMSARTS